MQAFMRGPCRSDRFKPLIKPYPVVHVHNKIAQAQAVGLLQEVFCTARPFGLSDQSIPQNILL